MKLKIDDAETETKIPEKINQIGNLLLDTVILILNKTNKELKKDD
jgi:hypothetical protein